MSAKAPLRTYPNIALLLTLTFLLLLLADAREACGIREAHEARGSRRA